MAQKISEQKIEEMFAAYCEQQTIRYVAEKCHVHRATVRRYRDSRGWDGRLAEVRKKTAEKVGNTIARDRARNLQLIDAALANFVKHLQGKATGVCECGRTVTVMVPMLKGKYTDLCELIKTHNLLAGDPTERTANANEEPKLIKYCLPVPPELRNPAAAPKPESKPPEAQRG